MLLINTIQSVVTVSQNILSNVICGVRVRSAFASKRAVDASEAWAERAKRCPVSSPGCGRHGGGPGLHHGSMMWLRTARTSAWITRLLSYASCQPTLSLCAQPCGGLS